MNIAYLEPLRRAFKRMKIALFTKPFNLQKWFVIGFTAFLAGLLDGPKGGSSGSPDSWGGVSSFRQFLDFPNRAWDWLINHPAWFLAIIFIVMFILSLLIVLTWLSSRGIFMFLDNVVHDKAQVAKPWKEFKEEGFSLFIWRLCFGLICFMVVIMFVVFFFITTSHLYNFNGRVPIPFIVVMIPLFLLMIIIMGYISLFLKDFVAPIMYKHKINATRAWGRFLSIFKQHPFHFILYGLFVFILIVLAIIAIVIAGILTCCIGLILFVIPYIGTVLTLPVWYTFRAFSLEYLAQFGPDFELFPPLPPDTSSENALA